MSCNCLPRCCVIRIEWSPKEQAMRRKAKLVLLGLVLLAVASGSATAQETKAGFRELSGQELANTKRSSDFYQSLKLRQLYPKMTLKGTEKVGQRESYVVEADPGDGSLRRMYLDVETGLLVRNDTELDTATQGRMKIEVYFDDYKEVDGVKVPFTVRQVNPNISWVIKATEVRHNVPVDDAKFAKPSAQ